jgi:hypothetical protein
MDLIISGIPEAGSGNGTAHCTLSADTYSLTHERYERLRQEPKTGLVNEPSCALLGRMDGQDRGSLAVALPHIAAGDAMTTQWSRKHACFHFEPEAGCWFITLLGNTETLLNGRPLTQFKPQPIKEGETTLNCGGITLQIECPRRVADDPFATMAGQKPHSPKRPEPVDPHATLNIPSPSKAQKQAVLGGAVGNARLEPMSVDSLLDQVPALLEQTRAKLAEATTAAQDGQQRRLACETARDEIRQAIAEIHSAPSREAVLSAARRATEAAARAKTCAERGTSARERARRASEQAEKDQNRLRELADEIARAAARLDARDAKRDPLEQRAREVVTAANQGERNAEQARDRQAESERAFEGISAAAQASATMSEEAQALAARRASEFLRRDRLRLYVQRYALIALTLLVAIAVGLAVGSLLGGWG